MSERESFHVKVARLRAKVDAHIAAASDPKRELDRAWGRHGQAMRGQRNGYIAAARARRTSR